MRRLQAGGARRAGDANDRGGVLERPLPVRLLSDVRRLEAEAVNAGAVAELRDLRAGGSRWR
jgi:hypothetical protein